MTRTSDQLQLIQSQSKTIDGFRKLAEPYQKQLAGLTITVLPNVYRGGIDSELLCEHMRIEPGDTVLDVCTGTGVVALKAAKVGASRVTGTDLNPAAIDNATQNQRLLNIINVQFVEADLFPDSSIHYDVITINPPFTNWRAPDKTALCFWDEDNRVIKTFFAQLRYYLKPSGRAYVAWASYGDQQLLPMLAQQNDMRLELLGSQTSPAGFDYYAYQLTFNPLRNAPCRPNSGSAAQSTHLLP